MRTDLISAYLTREWLQAGSPELYPDWRLDVSTNIRGLAEQIKFAHPRIASVFAAQALIAAVAINHWSLPAVALIAGGRPTPLHPRPDQLLYYSDKNPIALQEARLAGYNTVEVDAASPADLRQLRGAQTIIAAGLLHCLSDFEVQHFFLQMAELGVKNLVFSHLDSEGDQPIPDTCQYRGVDLYARSIEEIAALMTDHWRLERVEPLADFVAWEPTIGARFQQEQHLLNVFWLRRV